VEPPAIRGKPGGRHPGWPARPQRRGPTGRQRTSTRPRIFGLSGAARKTRRSPRRTLMARTRRGDPSRSVVAAGRAHRTLGFAPHRSGGYRRRFDSTSDLRVCPGLFDSLVVVRCRGQSRFVPGEPRGTSSAAFRRLGDPRSAEHSRGIGRRGKYSRPPCRFGPGWSMSRSGTRARETRPAATLPLGVVTRADAPLANGTAADASSADRQGEGPRVGPTKKRPGAGRSA